MILVTRLNGPAFALNPDLIERADSTPDTVITLVDGTKYIIAESLPELMELVRYYRAAVIAQAQGISPTPVTVEHQLTDAHDPDIAKIVHLHRRER